MLPKSETTTTVHAEIPGQMMSNLQALVESGWFRSVDEIFVEALRRYLDGHRAEWMEECLRADVEWGLHGEG